MDNVIENSNLPHINMQGDSSFITLVDLKKLTDTESRVCTNGEIMDEKL